MTNQPTLMTIKDVCREARVGRTFVYEQIKTKQLSALKLGGGTRIARTEFERWVGSRPTL